jgi:hypothetical protein
MSIFLKIFHNYLDDMQETGGHLPECLKQFSMVVACRQFIEHTMHACWLWPVAKQREGNVDFRAERAA